MPLRHFLKPAVFIGLCAALATVTARRTTLQTASEFWKMWNVSDQKIEHWVEGLRKAGVPEEPSGDTAGRQGR